MHVAINIVGFRNADDIHACLAALGTSTHTDFSVVICENGGAAGMAALAALPAALPGGQAVRVIEAPGNIGYAGGLNLAREASADADAWWILNPDTHPAPGALAALVARLMRGDCDAVGGRIVDGDGRVQSDGGHWRRTLGRPVSLNKGMAADAPVDAAAVEARMNYILGASLLASRRFVETTGPMPHAYFLYAEEVEWCLRGIARGMRLGFAPDAIVVHGQGTTTGSGGAIHGRSRLAIYLDERNKLNVVRDIDPRRLPVAVPATFALLLLRYARARAWPQLGYALDGWWAGVRGRRGRPDWVA